jgi:hypothetical protein
LHSLQLCLKRWQWSFLPQLYINICAPWGKLSTVLFVFAVRRDGSHNVCFKQKQRGVCSHREYCYWSHLRLLPKWFSWQICILLVVMPDE